MYGAGDVRVIDVPDPAIQQPTDAIVRVVRACICGSDLHPYHSMPVTPGGSSMGHEFIGVVEDTGDDVYGTGYHAAVKASVRPRTSVTVIGDGAVGLMAVLSAKRLGAERIILMGRLTARTDLGRMFGATDVVAERGDDGIERVRDLTGGDGTHVVLEAVGHIPAYEQAIGVVRPCGVISRVGVPQYENAPVGFGSLFGPNITLTGGPAPARTYIETLMPDVLAGRVDPGRVFDREVTLDQTPQGYKDMDTRRALKVLIRP
jgi:threonine dehydrogenase-like Zn-dependent dehydrogenase